MKRRLRYRWYWRTLLQELRLRKFWAIFRLFVDSKYRSDIATLCTLLSQHKLHSSFETVLLKDVCFSHAINYPRWVLQLVKEFESGVPPTPIKVIYWRGRPMVIDGNHRLRAMQIVFPPDQPIVVRKLTYV